MLLDTGSMVSTIDVDFCQEFLPDAEVRSLDVMIRVEWTSGTALPYLGYVEVDVEAPDISSGKIPALFLVVPHLKYHDSVPGLLGTNLLHLLLEGSKRVQGSFMQRVSTSTPWWLTYRC